MNTGKNLALVVAAALSVAACFGDDKEKSAAEGETAAAIVLPPAVEAPPPVTGRRNMVYISVGRYPHMRDVFEKHIGIVTDYNLAFINPTDLADGEIGDYNDAQKSDVAYIFRRVREEKPEARIYLSFGGWRYDDGIDPVYEAIAKDPRRRAAFIRNVMALADEWAADGVDMDWEYPRREDQAVYALFIRELANALHGKGKRLSVAIPGVGAARGERHRARGAVYGDSVLDDFDNINLMAYDLDGSGPNHSTYADAVETINYWVKERGVPPHKAILGLPVYARNDWIDYNRVVGDAPDSVPTADPANACRDAFAHDGQINYYNGLPTIIRKTRLAMEENLGGVMIWEQPLDAWNDDRLSIVRTIDATLNATDFRTYCDENGLAGTP